MKHVALTIRRLDKLGGLEKYTLRLSDAFQKAGCQVTLLTGGTPQLEIPEGIELQSLKWLEKNQPDIVFGMDRTRKQTHLRAGNGVHAEFLKKRSRVESFLKRLSFSISPMHRKTLAIEKAAFEDPDLQVLFTNSHMVKKEILHHYNVNEEKITVIHNGVEFEEMAPDFEKSLSHARDHFHLLFVGHGYKRKGLTLLLQAIRDCQNKEIKLSVVGKDKIAPFEKLAEKLGIANQVKFLGPRPDVRTLLAGADALAIPSLYDPFANITVEALAMGLTVLTSKGNGGKEVITNENGIIIENLHDPDSFTDALLQTLKRPKTPERAKKIRQSISHLTFANQLGQMVQKTLANAS